MSDLLTIKRTSLAQNCYEIAQFSKKHFPLHYRVLDIASGYSCLLSYSLIEVGYQSVTAIDPSINPKSYNVLDKKITKTINNFTLDTNTENYDLFIMRHGCELPEVVARKAIAEDKSFIIVFCHKPINQSSSKKEFLEYIKEALGDKYVESHYEPHIIEHFGKDGKSWLNDSKTRKEYIERFLKLHQDIQLIPFVSEDESTMETFHELFLFKNSKQKVLLPKGQSIRH